MEVNITGTIDVPTKNVLGKFSLAPWTYQKNVLGGKDIVTSFVVDTKNDLIRFPRDFKKFENTVKEKITFKDSRVEVYFKSDFELSKSFSLRPYQEEAVKQIVDRLYFSSNCSAILMASPGWGKTYTLPAVLKELRQRALVIVDRTDLVSQMQEEFITNSKCSVSVLSSTNKEVKDVNITTFQFLLRNQKMVDELLPQIGIIVVDECHIISIGAFTKIVNQFPAKYRLGLSATPTRSDGLTKALHDVMGSNVVDVPSPDMVSVTYLLMRLKYSMSLSLDRLPNKAWEKFFSAPLITRDTALLAKIMSGYGRTVMIYTTFSSTQEALKSSLKELGISAEIINQKTKAKDRKEILKKFQENSIQVLIAGSIMQKGISVHRLDTIINLSNHTKESLEQLIGRLRRKHKSKKEAIFIDLQFGGKGSYKATEREKVIRTIAVPLKEKVIKWGTEKVTNFIKDKK